MKYSLVDDALVASLEEDKAKREGLLFLQPHPDFIGQWLVDSFEPGYMFDLEEIVGPYRAVSPSKLEEFMDEVHDRNYEVAFFEDPAGILDSYDRLREEPEVALNSDFEGTVQGFLPYQVQGFNFLKDLEAGVAMWSTGTGKTVLASALLKYHISLADFDTAFFVVKAHNKVNTQRALSRLADIESTLIQGEKKRRRKLWSDLATREGEVIVTNYEKFRVDFDEVRPFFDGRRILIVWDEMPSKLKSRTSGLYKSVCQCLYSTNPPVVGADRLRPSHSRQYMLSATPIENDPGDWFNCIRLMDPTIYGTVKDFETEFVRTWNFFDQDKPETWHKLDKIGLKAAHITHQVDKDDPDIAKQFPEAIEEPYWIDWDSQDEKLYRLIAKEGDGEIDTVVLIALLQMLCCAPTMLLDSAAVYEAYEQVYRDWVDDNEKGKEPIKQGSVAAFALAQVLADKFTNERHTKLETLCELLCETHPNEKVVVFSAFNSGLMPILEAKLEEWNVNYVRYNGTDKQKQAAEDAFRDDPSVRVFLSSDQGSDSINLEAGSVVIHYDLPWKWSTKIQRQNRIHRVTSDHGKVRYYTLMMANSVEDRKAEVISRKQSYHQGVFKGAIADQSASARMTKEDLEYILTGER